MWCLQLSFSCSKLLWLFNVLCVSFWILGFFSISVKNAIGISTGILFVSVNHFFCISSMYVCLYVCMYFQREGKGRRKKGRETSICCLSQAHNLGPRHVPWLEIEPVAFWFAGQPSVHWATPVRAVSLLNTNFIFSFTETPN